MIIKTKLYNELAKDYAPKKADMNICKYIEGLEKRIEALEAKPKGGRKAKEVADEPEAAEVTE